MFIGGLQKISLLDYPGHVAAIIFTQGCNFRCPFCYNPMLVEPAGFGKSKYSEQSEQKDYPSISEDDLFVFLKDRRGKLDAVVVTGGEPTIHKDLPAFLEKIKKLGYLIKLDSNGSNPNMIESLINQKLVNYIAMDFKSSFDSYYKTIGVKIDLEKIKKSIKIIMESKLPYEFRTTLVPGLVEGSELIDMSQIIKGAEKWYLQRFQPREGVLDKKYNLIKPYTTKESEEFCQSVKSNVKNCFLR
jgi:pyruvate formate lyase activating enzyme